MHLSDTKVCPEKTRQRNFNYYEEAYSDIQRIRKTYEARLFSRNILCLPELKNVDNCDYLEIGFGTGLTLEAFWDRGLNSATGVEQSEKATRYLNERLIRNKGSRKFNLIQGSVEDTIPQLSGQQFDLIVLSNFIEHVKDDTALLKDLFLLLKPEGRLCMTYPTPFSINDPSHFRTYTPKSITRLVLNTLKDPTILRSHYQSPCLIGWFYSHILPVLLKAILKRNRLPSSHGGSFPSSQNKMGKTETFIQNIYHQFFVPLMIFAAPIDDCVGKWFEYGYQGVILVKKK